MFGDDVVQPGAAQRQTRGQVNTDTDGALMQVGLAAGLPGWQTQHRHHWITHQDDDADVRHAFVADAFEDLIRGHAVFDQRAITVAAQRIQASEDARDVMLKLFMGKDLARHRAIAALETVGNHDDAVTASALGRFDHKVVAPADDLVEFVDFLLGGDHAVQLRHVNAGRDGAFLGDDLVIDNRVQAALVVLEHVVRVAPVDAHDAPGFQGLPGLPEAEHQASAFFRKALKRTSSVRR
ncbi:hypothetical protein D3C86_1538160 [compost metagenome]